MDWMRSGVWISLAPVVAVAGAVTPASAATYAFHADHVLGTSLDMTVAAQSKTGADWAWQAAQAKIQELKISFSGWRTDSEISRLNRDRALRVSDDVFHLLERCRHWSAETSGAFDCRIGALVKAWKSAATSGKTPDKLEMEALAKAATSGEIRLDRAASRAALSGDFDLAVEAVAKGMIVDRAADAALAASPDIKGVIVNIGGDIRAAGVFPEGGARVGVAGPRAADNSDPAEIVVLDNAAIASSGAGGRDLKIGGARYSHILSPFTGRPQDSVETVTVVAPTAEAADALATAFAVSGVGASLGYANTHAVVETVIITRGGSRFASDGWAKLRAPFKATPAEDAQVANPWPEGWRLKVAYEIPRGTSGDYENPYVAVWVTDDDGKPVRNLLLLGDEPRWQEENYVHWRRVGRKLPAIVDQVARPTRPPGSYEIIWDGRDDHGRLMPQGQYTLHVECSREHGRHQYEKTALDLRAAPLAASIDPGAELGAVRIAYAAESET